MAHPSPSQPHHEQQHKQGGTMSTFAAATAAPPPLKAGRKRRRTSAVRHKRPSNTTTSTSSFGDNDLRIPSYRSKETALGRRLAYLLAALSALHFAQIFDVDLSLASWGDYARNGFSSMPVENRRSLRRQLSTSAASSNEREEEKEKGRGRGMTTPHLHPTRPTRRLATPKKTQPSSTTSTTALPAAVEVTSTTDTAQTPAESKAIASTDEACHIRPATTPDQTLRPAFMASYPGSGAKMSWMLTEALFGIVTGDEHGLNGHTWDKVVSVKSHYPHTHGAPTIGTDTTNEQFPRAVLLLRHPMDAIPSYHNFLYEQQEQLPGHSVRAPLDRWTSWSSKEYSNEIQQWYQHAVYWLDRYPSDRLILTFEGLTSEETGVDSAVTLVEFLASTDNLEPLHTTREQVACVWTKIVKYKKEQQQQQKQEQIKTEEVKEYVKPKTPDNEVAKAARKNVPASKLKRRRMEFDPQNLQSHRSGEQYRPYTNDQLDEMAGMLQKLKDRYSDDPQLDPILEEYLKRVKATYFDINVAT